MIQKLAAMAALVAAIIAVGYWVQSVENRLTKLEQVRGKPTSVEAECQRLASMLPRARGKTKDGVIQALAGLGCAK